MLLDRISDIDPHDSKILDLEQLATRFGIFNMTVVVMKTNRFQELRDSKVQMAFDITTYRQIVADLISLAVLNYASSKLENFSVAINTDLAQNYYRIYSAEEHKRIAMKFLAQVEDVLSRYEE